MKRSVKAIWFCMLVTMIWSSLLFADTEENINDLTEDATEIAETAPKMKGNFVVVPIPLSNPTIGTGLRLMAMYLHPKKNEHQTHNSTTGLMAMYTNTDSWMAGVFHDGYWQNGTYRFTGLSGFASLNLDFYGIGDNPDLGDHPVEYNIEMVPVFLKLQRRIPGTLHWFAGGHITLLDSNVEFDIPNFPNIPTLEKNINTNGAGLIVTYDSRDNNYYPTDGSWFEAKWAGYNEALGSDDNFNTYDLFYNHYFPLNEKTVLALRAKGLFSSGDTPFFMLPFLDMRGFSRGRYHDKHTISGHSEIRYKFLPRWGVMGFFEAGRFGSDLDALSSNQTITSYGGGLRWQVTKAQQMHL